MAIVEGLIKPWAKHQSKESAAQVLKQSVKGTDLAKKQAVKVHLNKVQNRFTQVVPIEQPKEVVQETFNRPKDEFVDNKLKNLKNRGVISANQPYESFHEGLVKDLKNAGVDGDIDLTLPKRQAGPLGDKQTIYRNYGQKWQETGRPQKESMYAELDGERFFTDVKDKSTGRLAIRSLGKKLDEVTLQNDWRSWSITEQTADPKALKSWNQNLVTPSGWEGHHLNMVKLISNIANGLDLEGRQAIYKHLGRRYNLWTGNSVFNKINLPPDIHDWVHAEMDRIGINYRKINFDENTSMRERLKYIRQYSKKMDEIQRFIYKKMSERASVASKLN